MPHSLEDHLLFAAPSIPRSLVGADTLSRIRLQARAIPPFSTAGFESVLGTTGTTADFAVWLSMGEPSFDVLAGDEGPWRLDPRLADHPEWRRLRSLCAAMRRPPSAVHGHISGLWLEIDDSPAPVPGSFGVFLSLVAPRNPVHALHSAVVPGVSLLRGELVSQGQQNALLAIASRLSPTVSILQAGVFFARHRDVVRLCLGPMSLDVVTHTLTMLGLSDGLKQLSQRCTPVLRHADTFWLHVDVLDGVLPRVGIELHLSGVQRPVRESAWYQLFDDLCAAGLCTSSKRDALVGWPGFRVLSSESSRLPPGVALATGLVGARASLTALRCWNHVKLTWSPQEGVSSKAYFGFVLRWVGHI